MYLCRAADFCVLEVSSQSRLALNKRTEPDCLKLRGPVDRIFTSSWDLVLELSFTTEFRINFPLNREPCVGPNRFRNPELCRIPFREEAVGWTVFGEGWMPQRDLGFLNRIWIRSCRRYRTLSGDW